MQNAKPLQQPLRRNLSMHLVAEKLKPGVLIRHINSGIFFLVEETYIQKKSSFTKNMYGLRNLKDFSLLQISLVTVATNYSLVSTPDDGT